ncbi:M56 family metallopeptidase [Hymenobacter sp. YC55]|uniref:M56 family metallopeptidase n=1 Tax=Hymenobacter sp. YC55 TaxID=3034019 RepID=UPI0023F91026|nr:M56 family metallopeptidase [Hymenobacter sp. YC55]MDF7813836.1 M56 family metallopeptidase [Hymenobacter sp. YC55]
MTPLLLYLLQAHTALLLFAAAYFGLLRRLTFFSLNRWFLLLALLFSALYPALPVPAWSPLSAVLPRASAPPLSRDPAAVFLPAAPPALAPPIPLPLPPRATRAVPRPVEAPLDWLAIGLLLYAVGTAALLARLLGQLLSLWQLHRQSEPTLVQGQLVRTVAGLRTPFSFGATIYLNPSRHAPAESLAVLRHEQAHVQQGHTLDVLLGQLALAAAWCNPAVWLLRRALLDNLEYLADQAALQTGLDRTGYQYSLLRLSHGPARPALGSAFAFSSLKQRLRMLQLPASAPAQRGRYALASLGILALTLSLSAASNPVRSVGPRVAPTVEQEPSSSRWPHLPNTVRTFIAHRYPGAQPITTGWTEFFDSQARTIRYYNQVGVRQGQQTHWLEFDAHWQPLAASVTPPARTRTTPAKNAAPPRPAFRYYVDGQLVDNVALKRQPLLPEVVDHQQTLHWTQIQPLTGQSAPNGCVISITTKARKADPAVVAFNDRLQRKAPLWDPFRTGSGGIGPDGEQLVLFAELAAPAVDYITTYLDAQYVGSQVSAVTQARDLTTGQLAYRVHVVQGPARYTVLFDLQGRVLPD